MPVELVVVLPSITGREELLERTKQGWRDSMQPGDPELRLLTVLNRRTIGTAWRDGLVAAIKMDSPEARVGWVVLGADDAYPETGGWFDACSRAVLRGHYPCPVVMEHGRLHSGGTLGAGMLIPGELEDGTPVGTSPFPFLDRKAARMLAAFGLPAVHYYADDLVAWLVRTRCELDPRSCAGYRMVHLEGTIGRGDMQRRAMRDRETVLQHVALAAAVKGGEPCDA